MKRIFLMLSVSALCLAVLGCGKEPDNSGFVQRPDSSGTEVETPPEEAKPDEVKEDQVKVISFNVRTGNSDTNSANAWDQRKAACPALLTKENPTVFGVQEALDFQIQYLKNELPEYACVGVGRDDGASKGEHMSIFYKKSEVTLDSWNTFWLSQTPDKPSKGWDSSYYRSATWTIFTHKDSGKKFFYLNTHLDHQAATARENSITLIIEKMKQYNPEGYPAILTADFNSETSDPIFAPLKLIMLDARVVAPKTDNAGTFNGWGSKNSIIDHIFFSDFKALEYRTIRDRYLGVQFVSDHYPVTAVLQF